MQTPFIIYTCFRKEPHFFKKTTDVNNNPIANDTMSFGV